MGLVWWMGKSERGDAAVCFPLAPPPAACGGGGGGRRRAAAAAAAGADPLSG